LTRQEFTRRFLCILLLPWLAGCGIPYVAGSAYHQAELMLARRPVERVLAREPLSVGQEQRLRLIGELKRYGREIGLSATDNYDTVSLHWSRTIWNVSACAPLAFEPETWRFPIVGTVPYLGYFTDADATRMVDRLKARGLDVHRRTAGAYSTLGWFRDPVLPSMLLWSEAELAETVFHELAHATLWVPGSVAFNESFASVVGEEAARDWLADRYGSESPELAAFERDDRDWRRFEAILHGMYKDLDTIYQDPARSDAEKLEEKARIYAGLADRVRASDMEDPQRYVRAATRSPWNNARLMQFKAYNTSDELFARALANAGGDLRVFIDEVRTATRGSRDPFVALAAHTGVKIP